MKILKYSLITISVLFLGFISIGVVNPSFSYESEVIVKADLQDCWDVFTNRKLMGDWMLDLEQVKLISGNEGEAGSEYEFTFIQNGETVVVREVVTRYEPPSTYAFDLSAEVLKAHTRVELSKNEEGTKISAITDVKPIGYISRSLFYLMSNIFKTQSDLQYSNFKKLAEETLKNEQ